MLILPNRGNASIYVIAIHKENKKEVVTRLTLETTSKSLLYFNPKFYTCFIIEHIIIII